MWSFQSFFTHALSKMFNATTITLPAFIPNVWPKTGILTGNSDAVNQSEGKECTTQSWFIKELIQARGLEQVQSKTTLAF